MNKKGFIRTVAAVLRDSDARKCIQVPRQVLHISDDEGNSRDFTVKRADRKALYTIEDVEAVLEACLYVIKESLKRGESITFQGFGSLGLRYRRSRKVKNVSDGSEVVAKGRYVPRFSFGNELRRCAQAYESSLGDMLDEPQPIYDEADGLDIEDGD